MTGLRRAVLLSLAGAALLLAGAGVTWASAEHADPVTSGVVQRSASGSDLAPGVRAVGVAAAVAVVALLATRGWGRRAVGALQVLLGAGGVLAAAPFLGDRLQHEALGRLLGCTRLCVLSQEQLRSLAVHRYGVWLALLGALLVVAAGALTAVRGGGWAGLGSSYDAPGAGAPEPVTDKGVWDALDRGDDPTA